MKKLLLFMILPLWMISCEKNKALVITDPVSITLSAPETEIVSNGNNFSLRVLKSVIEEDGTNRNIMISPYSLSVALSMTANGAAGATLDSMMTTLGFGERSLSELNSFYKKVTSAILSTDPSTTIAIANSIWFKNTLSVKNTFEQANSYWYDATVKGLDFSAPDAPVVINNWSSDKTNGLIKKVIGQINPNDIMYLLNAVYFKSIWGENFDFKIYNTTTEPFYKEGGQTVNVRMMNNDRKYLYFSDKNLTAISIPYGNGSFEYVALLPAQNNTVSNLADQISDEEYFNNILARRNSAEIMLSMPKFKYSFDVDLKSTLSKMGMGIAMDSERADFSNLFNENLDSYISMIKQYNYIELNEAGTEAASVTVVGVGVTSLPVKVSVKFNRPFLYFIREKSTGIVLFAGRIANP